MSSAPLSDVVVADFSRVLAGPLATMTLADLGATVVKVERPGAGDDTRRWGPPWSASSSTYFDAVNRGKLSVTLDLTDPHDLMLARRLAERADVLVENFKPGGLERLGLGYEAVSAANPGVVYCSISGFGTAAGAGLLGYDFLVQAVGGLMSLTGEAGGEPFKAGVALVDVLTGKDATIAILAALAARSRTQQGTHIEVALLTSQLAALVNQAQGYLETGLVPTRMGNRHPSIAPYETLHCADGLLAVAVGNDAQFARLVGVLGAPSLAQDERFATNAARVCHRIDLVAALEACLSGQTAAHWREVLVGAGLPAGVVGTVADGIALAERLGLEPLQQTLRPDGAAGPQTIRPPATFDGRSAGPAAAPPTLGADDQAVRAWLTGETASLVRPELGPDLIPGSALEQNDPAPRAGIAREPITPRSTP